MPPVFRQRTVVLHLLVAAFLPCSCCCLRGPSSRTSVSLLCGWAVILASVTGHADHWCRMLSAGELGRSPPPLATERSRGSKGAPQRNTAAPAAAAAHAQGDAAPAGSRWASLQQGGYSRAAAVPHRARPGSAAPFNVSVHGAYQSETHQCSVSSSSLLSPIPFLTLQLCISLQTKLDVDPQCSRNNEFPK